ncbi:MAG: substrate-binding domain-containing protein [Bacteroidales bacterium]|nr:substrate-binding domain-containing protein [Bacteroidales bacterium]MBQ6577326.1 substrate-binding domain-containing protein [Bacteroidales bacterium]
MLRLLIISDFTEAFPSKLLKGIINYSAKKEQWTICRMPPDYKKMIGIPGVVKWAKEWGADAVIGQFEQTDEVELFAKNGIVAVAQDFKQRFSQIPNITADYIGTGRMAARFYIDRGFKNFGFFGFNRVCWSDERYEGFKREVEAAGHGDTLFAYNMQDIDHLWYYEREKLSTWLRSLPKPIGIMACDDNQGNNLVEACHSLGIKIPSELSVMGVDNDELLCTLGSTPLSSIQVDIEDGGYRTAEMIEHRVLNPDAPIEDVILRPLKIIGRISTAAFATDDVQIQKAIQFIHLNNQKKISVKDVMGEVALSRRLLERRFKTVTGQTIYQYISDLKIKRFAELLIDTDEQITNLAISMGESDTKSISRRFKQLYGCSPNEWREKNQKKK